MTFSVVILTYNEEENISACLKSVEWADDVVVVDSFSTDQTCEIARKHGVRVFQRAFDDFGSQRNFAQNEVDLKYEWVFHLDADERFNEELLLECNRVISENLHSAWFVPNRIIFLGKWIKHCTQYPYPQVRLVKRGEVLFEKAGHGQREIGAKRGVGHIHVAYDHFNFSKGIDDWVARHNRYSSEEARLTAENNRQPLFECFTRDAMKRNRALKSWFVRMPFRPTIKFLYLYFFLGGFLDGIPGWYYCRLQSMYEVMIVTKIKELEFTNSGK